MIVLSTFHHDRGFVVDISPSYFRLFIIVVSLFLYRTFDFSSSLFRLFIIVFLTFDFSSSLFRYFFTVLSTFRHRYFDFSSSYIKPFTIIVLLFRLLNIMISCFLCSELWVCVCVAMALTEHRTQVLIHTFIWYICTMAEHRNHLRRLMQICSCFRLWYCIQ